MHAALVEKEWEISKDTAEDTIAAYAKEAAACYTYGTNMRGSAAYRQHLAEVLIARAIRSILTEGATDDTARSKMETGDKRGCGDDHLNVSQ